jgi:nitrogen fixation protein FixH
MILQQSRPFTGLHMLTVMLAFFGVIISANVTMVYFATHSWTGLVVPNSYVASQNFNRESAKLAAAAANIHAAIHYQSGELVITLTDNAGAPVDAMDLKITLGRPTHTNEDQTLMLFNVGNGRHTLAHHLAKGVWSGTATAQIENRQLWQRPIALKVEE